MRAQARAAAAATAAVAAAAFALAGCGDPLTDGSYLGDATIRIRGVVQGTLPDAAHAAVAVLWLGYSALAENRLAGVDSSVLPITRVDFPPRFTCELLSPPPGAGAYVMPDGLILPAFVRLGLLVVFDDVDQDGRLAIDERGQPSAPDRLLAQSRSHALIYVAKPPDDPRALDAQGAILSNWEAATLHYHMVEIDAPPVSGRVVDDTVVGFTPVEGAASL